MKTHPIYKVKSNYSTTLSNGGMQPTINLSVGSLGTFQAIHTASGKLFYRAVFNGNVIDLPTKTASETAADLPILLRKDNQFQILNKAVARFTGYSEIANSNFGNEPTSNMDAAEYEALAKQTSAALQAAKAARDAETARTGCKKPILNIGQKKKDYEKCLADNKSAANTPTYTPPAYTPYAPASKPFFKTGAGITVIVVGSLALVLGTVLLIKKFKK